MVRAERLPKIGCRDARNEVLAVAEELKATVGYSYRGKQWLESDNPYAVAMTGLHFKAGLSR